jgi:hypothetical protein
MKRLTCLCRTTQQRMNISMGLLRRLSFFPSCYGPELAYSALRFGSLENAHPLRKADQSNGSVVDLHPAPDPHYFGNLDPHTGPHPHQIKIEMYGILAYLRTFSSLYLEARIWIRIRCG